MSNYSKSNASSRPLTGESQNVLIPREKDFINAKSYLLQPSEKTEIALYDFLVLLIRKLYEQKSGNKPVNIEDLCRQIKRENYKHKSNTIKLSNEASMELNLAEIQKTLFRINTNLKSNHSDDEIEEKPKLPNLLQTLFYFEQAQIGFNREEIIRVWLAMRQLLDEQPIADMRFWGKIFGRNKNYYIVEAEMIEGKDNFSDELDLQKKMDNLNNQSKEEINQLNENEEDNEILDEPPKPDWKPPVAIPYEENGVGVNRKVYFVCNTPGEGWTRLSKVTPAQIAASRLIRKYLTGDLTAKIVSYPPFPGEEKDYLRALITRITATTTISPIGFYKFDEEEEEAEDEEKGSRSKFIEDEEFEPIPLKDLVDPSLANWVHHSQYILPQGRTQWWNPASKNTDEAEEDEEEEEEKEEMDEPEPESGPPLLTPINEDEEINGMPAWSTKLSSNLVQQYAVAIMSSNLWPGAHAFATGKTFDNIYIGWGQKYITPNLSPLSLAPVQTEFLSGPEITEIEDPTPDDEAAFRANQAKAEEAEEAEDAEEEEEEGEEEDD